MRPRLVIVVSAVTVGLTLLVAWAFRLKLEHAIVLAPLIVLAAGAAAGLVVLWTRVILESLRRRKHPRRIVLIALGAVALIVLLSLLGARLPRE